jgi:hypothetical protein
MAVKTIKSTSKILFSLMMIREKLQISIPAINIAVNASEKIKEICRDIISLIHVRIRTHRNYPWHCIHIIPVRSSKDWDKTKKYLSIAIGAILPDLNNG